MTANILENTSDVMWDALPDLVLSKVFHHLDKFEDRYSASQVCKNWARAFKFPELWRKMRFEIRAPDSIFDKRPYKFVNRSGLGQNLEELEILCWKRGDSIHCENFHNLMAFFGIMIEKRVRLKTFIFRKHFSDYRSSDDAWDQMLFENKMIIRFIGTQSNLVHFDLTGFQTPEVDFGISSILGQLLANENLKYLHLQRFFNECCPVIQDSFPDFRNVLGSFTRLVELHLNYSYIDERILRSIVSNCKSCFKVIDILYQHDDLYNDHAISNSTWIWVRKTCPRLEIRLRIPRAPEMFSTYSHAIPEEMGLHTFSIRTAGFKYKDDERDLQIDALMSHLSCHFCETLADLRLNFQTNRKYDENILIELVSSCGDDVLKNVSFRGVCSVQSAKTLCDIAERKTGIQKTGSFWRNGNYKRYAKTDLEKLDRFDEKQEPIKLDFSCCRRSESKEDEDHYEYDSESSSADEEEMEYERFVDKLFGR